MGRAASASDTQQCASPPHLERSAGPPSRTAGTPVPPPPSCARLPVGRAEAPAAAAPCDGSAGKLAALTQPRAPRT
eukprot:4596948-Pyramimonas_sp.AAC.1